MVSSTGLTRKQRTEERSKKNDERRAAFWKTYEGNNFGRRELASNKPKVQREKGSLPRGQFEGKGIGQ